jgi:predicted Zn finger-like uncharacterized protein
VILACPGCGTRYRLDETKLAGGPVSVKCRKCGTAMPLGGQTAVSSSSPPGPAPRAEPSSSGSRAPGSSARNVAPASRTALLADEARELRDFVRGELEGAGFEVSVTDNGEEALLLAGSHPFDLIILNAYLRRLLGIHVCERIKANPELRDTPVILMGALLGSAENRDGLRSDYGADDFIITSISREELARRLLRFFKDVASAGSEAARPRPGASAPPHASPGGGGSRGEDEAEIRRLARIMISDIEIYHPEKFTRALRDGTFFEAFSEDLARGKELIDQRFGHLPNRIQLLAAGLKDSLDVYRSGPSRRKASIA